MELFLKLSKFSKKSEELHGAFYDLSLYSVNLLQYVGKNFFLLSGTT